MKKTIIIITILTLVACEKQLDSVRKHNQTESGQMFNTPDGFQRAVNGAYYLSMYYLDGFFFTGEAQGNNLRKLEVVENTINADVFNFYHTDRPEASYSFSKMVWSRSYSLILNVNELLAYVKTGETDPVICQSQAEALFLRAITYFNMVRLYGMPYYNQPEKNLGVPVLTEKEWSANPVRNTVSEVYRQIINDLNTAIPLFNTDRGNSYGSKYAAYALLSEVYLYMGGTYESPDSEANNSAITNATEVIDNGGYALLYGTAYKDYYATQNTGNTEDIYAINTQSISVGSSLNFYYVYNGVDGGTYAPSPDLLGLIDRDHDLRYGHYFRSNFPLALAAPYDTLGTRKYTFNNTGSTSKSPGRQLRLIEMYLNRAEAYAKLKTADAESKARADLNVVLTRAGLPENNTFTGRALFDEILKQRRIELAFEGHNSFDIFRNGLTMQRNYPSNGTQEQYVTTMPADSPKILLRIPSDQIKLTPNIVQNEQ